jgi:hypothetical protein
MAAPQGGHDGLRSSEYRALNFSFSPSIEPDQFGVIGAEPVKRELERIGL